MQPKRTTQFYTDTGLDVPAVTTEQIREIDRIASEKTGPNLFQMMENAGRNLAQFTMQILGENCQNSKIVILAGNGGNGGGGICAARHLANRNISTYLCLTQKDQLTDVTAYQLKIYQAAEGKIIDKTGLEEMQPDLIIDALIGYSLNGSPTGLTHDLIRWANATGVSIVSLEVPSGVDATTGETPGVFIRPNWTLTLALPKNGLASPETGDIYLADIGIPPATFVECCLDYHSPFETRYWIHLNRRDKGF